MRNDIENQLKQMSGIRKLKRIKQWIVPSRRPKVKLTSMDCLLVIGLVMTMIGILFNSKYYTYYTTGRQEGIFNTILGSFYVERIEAGDTNYKNVSIFCADLAVVGLVISVISGTYIIAKYLRKRTKHQN
jgi:hypothetical protein